MPQVILEQHPHLPAARREVEYVERKGLGHPDTICDAVMESISVALCQTYLEMAGRVLHHNIDKGLLVAGQTAPRFGGGTFEEPMRLVVGDRATTVADGKPVPITDIVENTVRGWIRDHLSSVNPSKHLVIQNELRPGSAELVGIYDRSQQGLCVANDTSAAVGFAPLTDTEGLVLAAEEFLNSSEFKSRFPATGEDVKVMGVRNGRELRLTVAIAFVDRHIRDEADYFDQKTQVASELNAFLQTQLRSLERVDVEINTLDRRGRGAEGTYLTVLGTSAESGDGGEVGRGNRVNGLISLCRPMTMEAAAGKNPAGHVGKVYNVLAHQIAGSIYDSVDVVEEVYVWLCSQIGNRLDRPWSVACQVALANGVTLDDVERPISDIIHAEFSHVAEFTERLARGELGVY